MKLAAVRKSQDLESLKHGFDTGIFEKSTAKKVYVQLHRIVKGLEESTLNNKLAGPMEAPGQRIAIHDLRKKNREQTQRTNKNRGIENQLDVLHIEMSLLSAHDQVNQSKHQDTSTTRIRKNSINKKHRSRAEEINRLAKEL